MALIDGGATRILCRGAVGNVSYHIEPLLKFAMS